MFGFGLENLPKSVEDTDAIDFTTKDIKMMGLPKERIFNNLMNFFRKEATKPSMEALTEDLINRETERANLREEGRFESFLRESENLTRDFENTIDMTGMATSPLQKQLAESQVDLNKSFGNIIDRDRERTQTNLLEILTRGEDQKASVDDQIFQLETEKIRVS